MLPLLLMSIGLGSVLMFLVCDIDVLLDYLARVFQVLAAFKVQVDLVHPGCFVSHLEDLGVLILFVFLVLFRIVLDID